MKLSCTKFWTDPITLTRASKRLKFYIQPPRKIFDYSKFNNFNSENTTLKKYNSLLIMLKYNQKYKKRIFVTLHTVKPVFYYRKAQKNVRFSSFIWRKVFFSLQIFHTSNGDLILINFLEFIDNWKKNWSRSVQWNSCLNSDKVKKLENFLIHLKKSIFFLTNLSH